MVGLLLFGVILGPHVLGFFGEHRPIADFFAELGILLLMFSAGLEIGYRFVPQGPDPVDHLRPFYHRCTIALRNVAWSWLCPHSGGPVLTERFAPRMLGQAKC
jgi:hypothetical protein